MSPRVRHYSCNSPILRSSGQEGAMVDYKTGTAAIRTPKLLSINIG